MVQSSSYGDQSSPEVGVRRIRMAPTPNTGVVTVQVAPGVGLSFKQGFPMIYNDSTEKWEFWTPDLGSGSPVTYDQQPVHGFLFDLEHETSTGSAGSGLETLANVMIGGVIHIQDILIAQPSLAASGGFETASQFGDIIVALKKGLPEGLVVADINHVAPGPTT